MSNSSDTIAIIGINSCSGAERRQVLFDCVEALCARRGSKGIGFFVVADNPDSLTCDSVGAGGCDALAAELAREMGLLGPAVTVTSPLSPTLAAVDRACQSLRRAECSLALVAEMSASAVPASAVVLLLERLGEALFNGERIVAVTHGSLSAGQIAELSSAQISAADELRDAGDMRGLLEAILAAEQGFSAAGEPTATRRVVAAATRDGRSAQLILRPPPPPRPAGMLQQIVEPRSPRKRPVLARAYVPPANPLEAAIAGLWEEILGVHPVGVHDNFIELGGDSITGIKIIAALGEWLQQEISAASLYDAPTVATLTQLIVAGGTTARVARDQDDVQVRGERRRAKLQRLAQEKLANPTAPSGTASNESS